MKLVFLNGELEGKEFDLNPPGLSVGRETDNDIPMTSAASSRYHLKVEWENGKWFLKDLGSTNGTKLNGEKISGPAQLKPGDEIGIGPIRISYVEKKNAAPPPSPSMEQPEPPPPAPPPPQAAPDAQTLTDVEEAMKKEEDSDAAKGAGYSSFLDSFVNKPKPETPPQKGGGDHAEPDKLAEINFFGGKKTDATDDEDVSKIKGKHASILFYVLVIGLAICVVAGFLLVKRMGEDKAKRSAKVAKPLPPAIVVSYEKQITTPDNIFRYDLRLADKKIAVAVDDLRSGVRFKKEKKLTDENLAELEAKLKETDFFAVSEPQAGLPSDDGTDKLNSLTVVLGSKVNTVTVRNCFSPHSFQSTVDNLESFSEHILNIPTISLTKEERLKLSSDKFALAQRLYENKEAKADNLFNAIKYYQYVVEVLDVFEPKPEMYATAIKHLKESQTELESQVKTHLFKAQQAVHLNDLETARNELYQVTIKLDNEENPDYQRARQTLITIDEKLKKRKK